MDSNYSTFSYRFANGGLVARYVADKLPDGTYRNLDNLESRAENAISTRYGWAGISKTPVSNNPLPAAVQSLARMKALAQSYRYATAANGGLFRIAGDTPGPFTSIASGLSGGRASMASYRPANNSNPYMYIADNAAMLKDGGQGNAAKWGIAPPLIPAQTQIGDPHKLRIDSFTGTQTYVNVTGVSNPSRVAGKIGAIGITGLVNLMEQVNSVTAVTRNANVTTVIMGASHGYVTGMRVAVTIPADNSFNKASVVITVIGVNGFTYPNTGANVALSPSMVGATVSFLPSIMAGMELLLTDGVLSEFVLVDTVSTLGFTAVITHTYISGGSFSDAFVQGSIAANKTGTVTVLLPKDMSKFSDGAVASDTDIVQIWFQVNNPAAVSEVRLLFDVGDGSFTRDYYYKSVTPATWQPAVSESLATGDVMTRRVFDRAAARADNRRLGYIANDLAPVDLPDLHALRPFEINTGISAWSFVQVIRGEFVKVGAAGGPNNNWANVVAYRISIKAAPTSAVTIGIDDLAFIGGSGLNSFNGQPYDYRYTYYNAATGDESTPSIAQEAQWMLTPRQQPIAVTYALSPDPQVTHVRIYRRGGTLTQAWYLVASVPVSAGITYSDTVADADLITQPTLTINNDPPVTSLMPVPLDTTLSGINVVGFNGGSTVVMTVPLTALIVPGQLLTIGTPTTLEQAYVQSLTQQGGALKVFLFLQNPHPVGDPVTASAFPQQAMDLMAIAFEKAWLAGDPNNPHFLYYSLPFQPSSFPPQNFLEIGSPDAPIMALIEQRGQLFVFTTKRAYQVLGAGSAIPVVIPTGVKHGLIAKFAWAAGESVIFYESYDGIYAFQGSGANYISERVEWIWTGKNLGPVPAQDVNARSSTIMSYGNHELFIGYVDANTGARRRLIFHDVYQRWRNDSSVATDITAMNFEDDTGLLVIGGANGMIYQDRTGNFDWGQPTVFETVIPAPINFTLQTAQLDQGSAKASKVYNELTLDMDTNGQPVVVSLVLDSGNTVLALGSFSTVGRQQVQININNGDGVQSLNVGVLLSGAVTQEVVFHEVHIHALVEAEFRRSFDSYWNKWGTDEWKIVKQGWFEYKGTSAIDFDVFGEGDMSAPLFSFTLPPNPLRSTERVRFPATKGTTYRFVATSPADFQLYAESHIEVKPVCGPKGYMKQKLAA